MNVELFKRAIEIIEAIPEERLNLQNWIARRFDPECSTICCAAGWLARDPEMQASGLSVGSYGAPIFRGFAEYYALAAFFCISLYDAEVLFHPRHSRGVAIEWERKFKTDKELWLDRARSFLGQLEHDSAYNQT